MDDLAVRKRCEDIRLLWRSLSKGTRAANVREAIYRAANADGQRAGMERAAKIADAHAGELTREMCDGCGNEDDVATGAANDCARDIAQEIRQAAGEVK